MSDAQKKQNFLQGTALLAMATAIVKVIGALYKIPLNAIIGKQGFGYYSTAYEIYAVLLMISTAGLPVAMSRMISQVSALDHHNQVRRIYATARAIFLGLGITGSLLMTLFCRQLAQFQNQPDAWAAIGCLGPCVLLICIMSTFRGFFQGRSNMLPTVRLTDIFRQARESLIVMNAHRINSGELPELRRVDKDFFFMRRNTEEALTQLICDLCSTRLPGRMGIPADQIQVLSPTRKGGAGTVQLNRLLQKVLNPPSPGKKERQHGDFSFREGDRVMQIRNNYDILWKKLDGSAVGAGVFNGDIGSITAIDPQAETVTVVYDDREAEYDFSMLNELEPAYAMTVHKSQGSEYRAVILVAFSGSPYLLSRSVLYTAVTRARELLIVAGREDVVATMVQNSKRSRRYTGLKLRLQGRGGE